MRPEGRPRARRLVPLALALCAACGEREADAAPGTDAPLPRWTLGAEPELRSGTGDDGLHQVMDAVRLADGSVAIVNAGMQQVRIVAPDGTVRNAGREGSGPGEFQFPAWIGARGDTLWVADVLASRISRFSADGTFLGSAQLDEAVGLFPQVVGQYRDGTVLVAADEAAAVRGTGVVRGRTALLRLRPDGRLIDTLAVVASSEQFATASADGRGMRVETLPFGRRTVMALHGDVVYVGTGETAAVRAIDRQGRSRDLLRVAAAPKSVGPADIDAYWKNLVTTGGTSAGEDRAPPAGIPYPRTLPPYSDLHADADGRLWVAESSLPREWSRPGGWWIFSPDGRPLARIQLPPRALLLDAGRDWVLLREMDEQQREIVSLYRFTGGT